MFCFSTKAQLLYVWTGQRTAIVSQRYGDLFWPQALSGQSLRARQMYCRSSSTPYCWRVIRGVFGAAQCFRHSSHYYARPMLKQLKYPSDHVFLKQTHLRLLSFDLLFLLLIRLQGKVVRFWIAIMERYEAFSFHLDVVCDQVSTCQLFRNTT